MDSPYFAPCPRREKPCRPAESPTVNPVVYLMAPLSFQVRIRVTVRVNPNPNPYPNLVILTLGLRLGLVLGLTLTLTQTPPPYLLPRLVRKQEKSLTCIEEHICRTLSA